MMNKYELTIRVPMITWQTHHVWVDATHPQLAMIEAQNTPLSEDTLYKEKDPEQGPPPYEVVSYRKIINVEELETLE